MSDLRRKDIEIFSQYSTVSRRGINKALHKYVYHDKIDWLQFFNWFLLTMGIGSLVIGVIFFFAYNWDALPALFKLSLAQLLVIITSVLALQSRLSTLVRNSILTAACVLIGVMFAIYGQIYQTGADSYDFFLGWAIFSTCWVIAARFAPLWLIYIGLLNTTLYLYSEQVANHRPDLLLVFFLFAFNTIVLLVSIYSKKSPIWFTNVMSIVVVTCATLGICFGIFSQDNFYFVVLVLTTGVLYTVAIVYSLRVHRIFYMLLMAISGLLIFSTVIVKIVENELSFLLVTLFITMGTTLSIKLLIDLQKKWAHA